MDHADYRQKYDRPYSDNPLKKWSRMGKQMLDARHVADDSGCYVGGAGSNFRDNAAGGAEVGVTNYSTPWLSSKMAFAGQFNSGARNAFAGVNSAVHVSTPTRVAPFVGAGLFGGVDIGTVIDTLGTDDEDDDEESTDTKFLGAIYPEVGVHVWLTGRTRLTASASYWVTTAGRQDDFWYYGLGLTFNFGPESRTSQPGEQLREDEFVNRMLDQRDATSANTRHGSPDPAVKLTAGLQDELSDEHGDLRSAERRGRETRAEQGEPFEFRSPSVLDQVFPPLILPPPPSRALSSEESQGYVAPPSD